MAKDIDVIESDRLTFRGITEKDAVFIVEWRSDPDVYRYFKNPHKISLEEHLNWYKNSYLNNDSRYDWMCIESDSGERIGIFGIVIDGDTAEVNYLLSPNAQHKGYATEGVMSLAGYSVAKWSVKKFIAEIHKDNAPSIALAERLGFSQIGTNGPFTIYGFEV